MGWNNPPIPWSEFEKKLTDASRPGTTPPVGADGGDSPGWSLKRAAYQPPEIAPLDPGETVPYAELHAHSSFSFLDGASMPEALVEEAARLGLTAIALTDHDGFYGIARLAEAAAAIEGGPATIFGAELSLGLRGPQNGVADPEGIHLLVLARKEEGYHRLASAITTAQLRGGEKGRPVYDLEQLAEQAGGPENGHWLILTGCRKGAVRRALALPEALDVPPSRASGSAVTEALEVPPSRASVTAAGAELDHLVELFGADNVVVELFDHGDPLDSANNDALFDLARERDLRVVATGNTHYATPAQHHLHTALSSVRARRSLDEMDGWLPASGGAHLRSGAEMAARFARYPGAIANTVALAEELAFELRSAKPDLPDTEVPEGFTPMSYLRKLVWDGVPDRYATLTEANRARIEGELTAIEQKHFAPSSPPAPHPPPSPPRPPLTFFHLPLNLDLVVLLHLLTSFPPLIHPN
jgi:error-prone DNA polymerase